MPTTSWQVANAEIQRPFGFEDFATTTNITTNNNVISTELTNRWTADDWFIGFFLIIRGTNQNDEIIRRVTDYTGSSGTLVVAGAALTSESAAVTCEVSRFHPSDIKRAFNRARQNVFPQIGIVRDIQTLVTGEQQYTFTVPSTVRRIRKVLLGNRLEDSGSISENLLTNADFETWTNSTTPGTWALSGSGASMNQESQTTTPKNYMVLTGSNSLRLVVPSSTATTVLQTVTPDVGTEGVECNAGFWVYCTTANRVSVQIGSGNTGTAHSGTGWEFIVNTQNLGATATTIADVGINVTSGAAIPVFIDHGLVTLGQSELWDLPWTEIENFRWIPPVAGASNGGLLEFDGRLPEQRRLRLLGVDLLSSVSADSDTIEIDGDTLEPVYNLARSYLCEERSRQSQDQKEVTRWLERSVGYLSLAEASLDRGVGTHLLGPRVKSPSRAF